MYKLTDKAMGIDCDYAATGETMEEVMEKSKTHVMTVHPDESMKMSEGKTESDMMDMMKGVMEEM